jgi:hypothetical protein
VLVKRRGHRAHGLTIARRVDPQALGFKGSVGALDKSILVRTLWRTDRDLNPEAVQQAH